MDWETAIRKKLYSWTISRERRESVVNWVRQIVGSHEERIAQLSAALEAKERELAEARELTTEHAVAWRAWAKDVLGVLAAGTVSTNDEMREAIEAKLAEAKRPEVVLREAERLLREAGIYGCSLWTNGDGYEFDEKCVHIKHKRDSYTMTMQSLAEAYAALTAGDGREAR